MDKGTVIILNGTSSSGKTSIVKALQEVLDEPYLDAGIDKFLFMLPKCYLNEPLWHRVIDYFYADPINRTGLSIKAGPVGHRVIAGMHRSIAALARAGNNVVADHVLFKRPSADGSTSRSCVVFGFRSLGCAALLKWSNRENANDAIGLAGQPGHNLTLSMLTGCMIWKLIHLSPARWIARCKSSAAWKTALLHRRSTCWWRNWQMILSDRCEP